MCRELNPHKKIPGRVFPRTTMRPRCRTGLTLTEVIMASAILIVAMVPILKGLTNAHLNSVIIERRTRSLTLANMQMEKIRAQSIYHYDEDYGQSHLSLDGSYLCNITDQTVESDLRQITVAVGFDLDDNNALSSDEIEVTLSTLIARRWEDG